MKVDELFRLEGKVGHAGYHIYRGFYFMAYPCKKFAFCMVGSFGSFLSLFKINYHFS